MRSDSGHSGPKVPGAALLHLIAGIIDFGASGANLRIASSPETRRSTRGMGIPLEDEVAGSNSIAPTEADFDGHQDLR